MAARKTARKSPSPKTAIERALESDGDFSFSAREWLQLDPDTQEQIQAHQALRAKYEATRRNRIANDQTEGRTVDIGELEKRLAVVIKGADDVLHHHIADLIPKRMVGVETIEEARKVADKSLKTIKIELAKVWEQFGRR